MRPRLIEKFFPDLWEGEWGYINANEIAKDVCDLIGVKDTDPNPFLNSEMVDKWMGFAHKLKEIDYSWGGYLEDRSTLWRGHYHKPGEVIHLGVDINVPEGTPVKMPSWGILRHSFLDPDQNGGWGGKLIFQMTGSGLYMVLGHLRDIPTDVGSKFSPAEHLGYVAGAHCNGGWGPHLHVQYCREFNPDVDGYGPMYDGIEKDFPDPLAGYKQMSGDW
jgi:murein DD-endopeptidase MepM/ murein hydrolase activator NlpD